MGATATKSAPVAPRPTPAHNRTLAVRDGPSRADVFRLVVTCAAAAASWTANSPRLEGFEPVSLAAAVVGGYPLFCEASDNFPGDGAATALALTIAITAALTIQGFTLALLIQTVVLTTRLLEQLTFSRWHRTIRALPDQPSNTGKWVPCALIPQPSARHAAWLVYSALAAAVLTFAFTHNIRSAIAVLLVAGTSGVVAGEPLAILGAIGRASKSGAIVQDGRTIASLYSVDTVILDKTGAFTLGDPNVVRVTACPGITQQRVVELAAIAERACDHPIGKAILKMAAQLHLPGWEPETFEYLPGRGVRCAWNDGELLVGNTKLLQSIESLEAQARTLPSDPDSILVAYRGLLVGSLRIEETLHPQAADAVSSLYSMGLDVLLLTGDGCNRTRDVARQLAITDFAAELLPGQRLAKVRTLVRTGKRVVVIGDGVNDAPALAEATVGIAMRSGRANDGCTAGIVVNGNHLRDCVAVLQLARRCRNITLFNLVGTLVLAALGAGLAATGVLSPLLAVIVRVISELGFIVNSARLMPDAVAPSR